jgi:hypothetical protein
MGKLNIQLKDTIFILAGGMLWGLVELAGVLLVGPSSAFYIYLPSVLTAIALPILFSVKKSVQMPGVAIIMALIAIWYKSIGHLFFPCMAVAVLCLAATFDFAFWLTKDKLRGFKDHIIFSAVTIFSAFLIFSIIVTFIIPQPFWVAGGFDRIAQYILLNGTLAVCLAAPLFYLTTRSEKKLYELHVSPNWVSGTVTALCIVFLMFVSK